MSERDWEKLEIGAQLVNKRAPGIALEVTEKLAKGAVKVRAPHGDFVLYQHRHSEFALLLKQEKLPL